MIEREPSRRAWTLQPNPAPGLVARAPVLVLALLVSLLFCGCATPKSQPAGDPRPFDFSKDTFSYPNELVWEYFYDANGKWTTRQREPKPEYTLHCFVVARSARQFFENARFAPEQPVADEKIYRRLIRKVVSVNPRKPLPGDQRILIPGYADLRSFSAAWEKALKSECGGAWQCYFQRGNWRMIFPFRHHGQEKVAETLLAHLTPEHPAIVHVLLFPSLTINHTVLVFDVKQDDKQIQFIIYDPNRPDKPGSLIFDRATRTFELPPNNYFPGGPVKAYEIYCKWDY